MTELLQKVLGGARAQTDITFTNEAAGQVTVFTVTGDVMISIIPVVTTTLTSAAAANISLGVVGDLDAMIVDSLATNLVARGIWVDQTPDNEIEPLDRVRSYIITDGNDVQVDLDAQIDTGAITFYAFWTKLSSTGNVVEV